MSTLYIPTPGSNDAGTAADAPSASDQQPELKVGGHERIGLRAKPDGSALYLPLQGSQPYPVCRCPGYPEALDTTGRHPPPTGLLLAPALLKLGNRTCKDE
jgi:hypothetical protein